MFKSSIDGFLRKMWISEDIILSIIHNDCDVDEIFLSIEEIYKIVLHNGYGIEIGYRVGRNVGEDLKIFEKVIVIYDYEIKAKLRDNKINGILNL